MLRLAQGAKLQSSDLLWRPSFGTWQPISSVPGVLTLPGPGIPPPPSPASALTNDETVRWIDRLPHRWTRNGAIIGLLWCLPFLALEIREKTDSSAAVAGLLLVAGLVGGLACLTGLAARRRLRRIVSLDVGEALSALRKLPREFAIWGAGAGVLLAILIGDWQGQFHRITTCGCPHPVSSLGRTSLPLCPMGVILRHQGTVRRSRGKIWRQSFRRLCQSWQP
ncbi:MAG: hypothetical protein H7X74_05155 [Methyloceanibacter sp.]|nr:hypothetical protein [Methyloceanibacter sp.]